MGGILISIFTFILLLVCGLMTVIILMQKPSANAGMGAALGGGAAESVFGGETANVLLKYTVRVAVIFFVLSFLLYIGNIINHRAGPAKEIDLPPASALGGVPSTSTTGATSAKTTTTPVTAMPAVNTTLKTDGLGAATNGTVAPKATPAASAASASASAPATK